MTATDLVPEAMDLALQIVGHPFPRLSRVSSAGGVAPPAMRSYVARLAAPEVTSYAYFLTDVTVTDSGEIRLIEANGSNAALSSAGLGRDDDRAEHMAKSFMARGMGDEPAIAVLSHQEGFIHISEFVLRARGFAQRLQSAGRRVSLRHCDHPLGDEAITVICGPIGAVARQVTRSGRDLAFRGRRIAFASNTNLLPELVRLGTVEREGHGYGIDDRIFHEGRATPIVHDKGIQQELAMGTGIAPLLWREAYTPAEWLDVARWFRERRLVAVAKMHAGSGGCGIEVLTPDMTDEQALAVLDRIRAAARRKHGHDADSTVFPVRAFEFAKARPYELRGKSHLWDLRLQVLVSPGEVEVRPCVVRLAPAPFDDSYSWDSVVSNLTGRDGGRALQFMRVPGAERRSRPCTVLDGLGLTEADLHRVMIACGRWGAAAAAWGQSRPG